jgi:hypothetical protein
VTSGAGTPRPPGPRAAVGRPDVTSRGQMPIPLLLERLPDLGISLYASEHASPGDRSLRSARRRGPAGAAGARAGADGVHRVALRQHRVPARLALGRVVHGVLRSSAGGGRQNGRVSAFEQESDPPSEGVSVLGYGKSLRVRRVRCTSTRTGMRCVHRPSGHGYLASRGHIRTF